MNTHTMLNNGLAPAAPFEAGPKEPDRVAIVDPYSTGEHLAGAFAGHGLEAVAVLTMAPPSWWPARLHDEQYAAVIDCHDDPAELTRQLRRLRVRHVLAGMESGVQVADRLAAQLGLPGNDPASSAARRDKFAMARALADAGVRHPRTLQASSVGQAEKYACELGWPVVVKPADSAGSDQVTIACSLTEVSALAADILNTCNLFGQRNETVIVQQYLVGRQYAVNTVSRGGVHRVVEVWHDRRTDLGDGRMIYDRMDLLAPDDALLPVLTSYVRDCLDALGIVHGPAHSEVMLTTSGPILIETGARLQGGDSVALMRGAIGTSQTDAAVTAALDSAVVHTARTREPYPYAPVTQLFLQAPADSWIGIDSIDRLMQIQGVTGCVHNPAPGATVQQTVNLLTSPATVYLTAETPQQVDLAYAAVRRLESIGFYQSVQSVQSIRSVQSVHEGR